VIVHYSKLGGGPSSGASASSPSHQPSCTSAAKGTPSKGTASTPGSIKRTGVSPLSLSSNRGRRADPSKVGGAAADSSTHATPSGSDRILHQSDASDHWALPVAASGRYGSPACSSAAGLVRHHIPVLALAVAPDSLTGETVWLPSPNLQHRLQATLACRALIEEIVSEAFERTAEGRRRKEKDRRQPQTQGTGPTTLPVVVGDDPSNPGSDAAGGLGAKAVPDPDPDLDAAGGLGAKTVPDPDPDLDLDAAGGLGAKAADRLAVGSEAAQGRDPLSLLGEDIRGREEAARTCGCTLM